MLLSRKLYPGQW